jgi:serine/threonine protein kinase/tetratricopeptide (TPR) repeat protein
VSDSDEENLSATPSLGDSFERMLAEPADAIAAPLLPGTIVGGRYEVIERIGAGAMGMVFLATDRDLQRKIALKLHKRRAATAELRREALAMARLAHPNVVTVFEVGEHQGSTFVAMEYIAGTTLRSWLAAAPRTRTEILDALTAAGEGLIAAHEANLVHRDFKPENVLIGRDGRVRVSDFGLAREVDLATPGAGGTSQATGIAGTPAYMAPEQGRGISVDARADQYAFCAVAWETLVGRWPRDDRPTRNPRIRRVLERGLDEDPGARFASMRELLVALRGATSHKRLALGVGVAVLLAGAGAAVFAISTSEDPPSCDAAGAEVAALGADVIAKIRALDQPIIAQRVEQHLAAFATPYRATARAVCKSYKIDRTWSQDLYQRAMQCLDLRLRSVHRMLEGELTRSSAEDLVHRVVAARSPDVCGDATVLATRPVIPAARLDAVVAAHATLEAAWIEIDHERESTAEKLVASVAESDDPFVAVRLDLARAALRLRRGESDGESLVGAAYYRARSLDDIETMLDAVALLIETAGQVRLDKSAETNWLANGLADAERAKTRSPIGAANVYLAAAGVGAAQDDPDRAHAWLAAALPLIPSTRSTPQLLQFHLERRDVYIVEGKEAEALADAKRALEIVEELFGPSHLAVARTYLDVSAAYNSLGKIPEARTAAEHGEKIMLASQLGPSQALAKMKLSLAAALLDGKGELARVRTLLEESRVMTEKVLGPDHRDLAKIDTNLAEVALRSKDFAEARRLNERALALIDRVLPDPHTDRGYVYFNLSAALQELGDHTAALTAAEAAATQFRIGDDRRAFSYAKAARAATPLGKAERALELVAEGRAGKPVDPFMVAMLALENARALITLGRDPTTARADLDIAHATFVAEDAKNGIKEVEELRARLH